MSGTESEDRGAKPRGSLFDALRDRTRVVTSDTAGSVPRGLRLATAFSWRLLVVAAAAGVVIWLVIQLKLLVIPLLISILITALLWPAFTWMLRHRVPKWLAIVVSVIGTIAIVAGLLWLAVWQITRQWASVQTRTVDAVEQFRQYLIDGPLHLTATQIDDLLAQGWDFLQQQAELLWSGALAIGTTLGHVATGLLLTVFILLCLLADGAGIWKWTTRIFPRRARPAVDGAAKAGWATVVNYARTQLLVATID
ncbi:MAG: AI-2E family transporter, partial [Microbacteriaceae bacterium]